ncbi:MAG TPA: hypothetical protein DCF73_19355 [Rhodobiaceae bacterium]|nr:hypothetical protein [Rhodobiaceae bacterium]
MARITIGVPVYNGAATLERSLESIRMQTYCDFEVIISDNASTDNSASIAQGFVDKDPRFKLVQREENVGPVPNFFSLLEMAQTELFMWRADDDWSNAEYIEELKSLFDVSSQVRLAGPETVMVRPDGSIASVNSFSAPEQSLRAFRVGHTLMNLSASSIYGLWHRQTLVDILTRTRESYPYIWAWDHIAMLPVILSEGVSGTNAAKLYVGQPEAARYSAKEPARVMWEMRRVFRRACFAELRRVDWPLWEKALLAPYLLRYANVRVYRFWKTLRRQLRQLKGQSAE